MADAQLIPNVQTWWEPQGVSMVRNPTKFIILNDVVVSPEVTIWTPAAGKKFRLTGFLLTPSVATGNIALKDNTGGTTIFFIPRVQNTGANNIPIASPPMGNGILSAAANNVLTATGVATQTLSGTIWGTEE